MKLAELENSKFKINWKEHSDLEESTWTKLENLRQLL
jgi:hypothetical protein